MVTTGEEVLKGAVLKCCTVEKSTYFCLFRVVQYFHPPGFLSICWALCLIQIAIKYVLESQQCSAGLSWNISAKAHENISGMSSPSPHIWLPWAGVRSANLSSRKSSQEDALAISYTRARWRQGCPLGARLMKKKMMGVSCISPENKTPLWATSVIPVRSQTQGTWNSILLLHHSIAILVCNDQINESAL